MRLDGARCLVMSNYEGKTSYSLGVIGVNIVVGTITRSILFVVIASKVNYNLMLAREWIHGVWAVPSTLHQRISIWRPDGVIKNIKVNDSYFLTNINKVDKITFDKRLTNIFLCMLENCFSIGRWLFLYGVASHPWFDMGAWKYGGEVRP